MRAKNLLAGFLVPVLLVSCLHTKTGTLYQKRLTLKIVTGNALLQIYGKINENLYYDAAIFNDNIIRGQLSANPAVMEGTVTINEELYLSTGEEYSRSLQPAEVVTITIRSTDNNDVAVTTYLDRWQRKYTVDGTNRLGLTLSFQNR
ncbi:MAG: hypothetical protein LBQ35_03480 [Spirochaetaceae bacterium]|jgi:hypothetical protein|nr:hypothetical protein [Spirochaetaceae bacterium]